MVPDWGIVDRSMNGAAPDRDDLLAPSAAGLLTWGESSTGFVKRLRQKSHKRVTDGMQSAEGPESGPIP